LHAKEKETDIGDILWLHFLMPTYKCIWYDANNALLSLCTSHSKQTTASHTNPCMNSIQV